MARPWSAKVGRHVTYYDANGKARPATITATGSTNGGVVLRVERANTVGDATTGILRSFAPNARANTFRVD